VKRPGPVRFDDAAAAKWRRLIVAARAQAASSATLSGLGSAAAKASKAVSPPGLHFSTSASTQLCRLGATYAGLHADQRAAARLRLADLAAAVERAVPSETSGATGGRRHRADIDD